MTCGSAASKAQLSLFLDRAHELGSALILRVQSGVRCIQGVRREEPGRRWAPSYPGNGTPTIRREIDIAEFLPALSITTMQASNCSTSQGCGKRGLDEAK
jgi:hypothetical protein